MALYKVTKKQSGGVTVIRQLAQRVNSSESRITESSHDTNYPAWGAFNRTSPTNLRYPEANTCWCAANGEQTSYIQYDLLTTFRLTSISIICFSNYSGTWVGNIQVLGSTDSTNWTNILDTGNTYQLTAPLQQLKTTDIPLNPSNEWRYIRIQGNNFDVYYSPSLFIDEIYVYGYTVAPTITSIYSINQSQGGVWINTEITASDYNKFLFVYNYESAPNDNLMRQIPTADIAVYTGGQDVYTTIFNATTIVKDFNVRIYNNELYVSFNGLGSNTRKVMICIPSIIIN